MALFGITRHLKESARSVCFRVGVLAFISLTLVCSCKILLSIYPFQIKDRNVFQSTRTYERSKDWSFETLSSTILQVKEPHDYYDANKGFFCNKCDHEFYNKSLALFQCCHDPDAVVLMGGLNEGALADIFLSQCQGHVHGFEIQVDLYEKLLLKYASEKRIHISHMGLSREKASLPVTGGGEGAGTYTSFRNRSTWDGNHVARVTDLWSYIEENRLQNICMVHIDVEGHEPQAIQGLQISKTRIPVITYELGGTWVDSRHESTWSQTDTAKYFIQHGYRVHLIGKDKMMEIDQSFFEKAKGLNEGYGRFIQGNLLALMVK